MYSQGDIVSVDFPFSDGSITKKRPALVISNQKVNSTGDYLLVQITSKVQNDGLSLQIGKEEFAQWELPLKSYIRIHKIFLLNESLIIRKVTSVKKSFLTKVISRISEIISLM